MVPPSLLLRLFRGLYVCNACNLCFKGFNACPPLGCTGTTMYPLYSELVAGQALTACCRVPLPQADTATAFMRTDIQPACTCVWADVCTQPQPRTPVHWAKLPRANARRMPSYVLTSSCTFLDASRLFLSAPYSSHSCAGETSSHSRRSTAPTLQSKPQAFEDASATRHVSSPSHLSLTALLARSATHMLVHHLSAQSCAGKHAQSRIHAARAIVILLL